MAIGRGIFRERPHRADTSVHIRTERDVAILEFLMVHRFGALPLFFPYTKHLHKNDDGLQKRLRQLWEGGYIYRPRKQRQTEYSDNNYFIYELDERGVQYLKDNGRWQDTIQPHHWWVHDLMTAWITGSIHVGAALNGWEYIPGHKVLERSNAPLTFEHNKPRKPDQLFGLKGPQGYRFYVVEAERANEKDYPIKLAQYEHFIGGNRYKDHYGLKARLMALFVFNSKARQDKFLNLAAKAIGNPSWLLTRHVPNFTEVWKPPKTAWTTLFDEPWLRVDREPFYLNR